MKTMTPSSRPCDVAYRLKRYNELLTQAQSFLAAIEPSALGEEIHAEMIAALAGAKRLADTASAPAKKAKKIVDRIAPVAAADGIPYTEEDEEAIAAE